MLFDTLRVSKSSIIKIYLHYNQGIDDECMRSLGEYIKSNNAIESIAVYQTRISEAGIEILAPYLEGNMTFKKFELGSSTGITDKSIPFLEKMIKSSRICNLEGVDSSITKKNTIYVLMVCNGVKCGLSNLQYQTKDLDDENLIMICESIKKYGIDNIVQINFGGNHFTSKGVSMFFDSLRECNSVISKLNLFGNQIDDACMKQLGEFVRDNEYLTELSLDRNKITDKGVEILSEYLFGNTKLRKLDLHENKGMTDASVPYLIEIAKKTCLTEIFVRYSTISDENIIEINRVLSAPIEEREIPIKSNTKSAAKLASVST